MIPYVPNVLQVEALEKMNKNNTGIIAMPCGTGKTLVSAIYANQLLTKEKDKYQNILVVSHNIDILKQMMDLYKIVVKNKNMSFYTANEKNKSNIVFATIQTLLRNLSDFEKDYFDILIVDEAHHYGARQFSKFLRYFNFKKKFGFTATPFRSDGVTLKNIGDIIYKSDLRYAIEKKILSPFEYYFVDNDIDFSQINFNGHVYDQKSFNRVVCIESYDNAIYNEYVKAKALGKKRFIGFCHTQKHAIRMKEFFEQKGVNAQYLTSSLTRTSLERRKNIRTEIIDDFNKGFTEVLFVRDMLNEGIDIPQVDCILMLRPTLSSIIFQQQLGRGLRFYKNKKYLLVLDFSGNARRCSIGIDVLSSLMRTNISEIVKKQPIVNRELIIIKDDIKIRLSKVKVDLLMNERESWKKTFPSKQDLIDNYFKVKNIIKRIPIQSDMKSTLSDYSFNRYLQHWEKWSNFIKEVEGLSINIKNNIKKKMKNKMRSQKSIKEIKKEYLLKVFQEKYNVVTKEIFGEAVA